MNQRYPRIFAVLFTLAFFSLIWLYTLEFPILSNTMGGGWLIMGSMLIGMVISVGIIWRYRSRFIPLDRHRPDVTFIIVMTMFFSPLLGSWINRGLGKTEQQSFEFVAEKPFFATGYGILQGEKLKVSGYHLLVKNGGAIRRFKYKTQAYYPLTKPGEMIILPIRQGIFGARVMLLQ